MINIAQLKGIEKLNKAFEQFFAQLGYDEIECHLASDFTYYDCNLITYSLFELPLNDKGFSLYLQETYPFMPDCSIFMFSLLHELGHHLTVSNIKRKTWLHCKKQKKMLENKLKKSNATEEIAIKAQIDYCKIYDEKIATKEAVNILIENYDFITEYEKTLNNAILNFYHENNITDT